MGRECSAHKFVGDAPGRQPKSPDGSRDVRRIDFALTHENSRDIIYVRPKLKIPPAELNWPARRLTMSPRLIYKFNSAGAHNILILTLVLGQRYVCGLPDGPRGEPSRPMTSPHPKPLARASDALFPLAAARAAN
jgi:hypothetical protein